MQTKTTKLKTNSNFFPLVTINQLVEKKKVYMNTLTTAFIILEILCLSIIFLIIYFYRMMMEFNSHYSILALELPRIREYALFYILVVGLYVYSGFKNQLFSLASGRSRSEQLFQIIKAYSYAILITVGFAFIVKIVEYSRIVVFGFWIGGISISCLLSISKMSVFTYLARKGITAQNVLIVGAGKAGEAIAKEFEANSNLGYRVVGFVDDNVKSYSNGFPVLGRIHDILKILSQQHVDELIVTIPSEREVVNGLIQELRKFDLKIKIIPDTYNLVTTAVEFGQINAFPYVTLVKTPVRGVGLFIKRSFDIVASLLGIFALLPFFLVIACFIKMDSKGPIFYRQHRIGKNGQIFRMYKFRSMVSNADELRKQLESYNEVDGPVFKIRKDPRITRIGRFIRKYSIDELPQLFNVLKGEMSIVGPRPPLPKEVEKYGDWEWRRLEVLPGITGLWQVSGRSDLSFQQWMNLDVYYIENWSFTLDIKIMLKTIPVVFRGRGAY